MDELGGAVTANTEFHKEWYGWIDAFGGKNGGDVDGKHNEVVFFVVKIAGFMKWCINIMKCSECFVTCNASFMRCNTNIMTCNVSFMKCNTNIMKCNASFVRCC